MDRSQTQLGERRTHPWVGLRLCGERLKVGCGASGLAREVQGEAVGTQANPPSCPAQAGHLHPKHRLQEAAYQRGCPMSSTLFPLRAETCVSMTLSLWPAGVGWGAAHPNPITQAQRARLWPRAFPSRSGHRELLFSELRPLGRKLRTSGPPETCWPDCCLSKSHTSGLRVLPGTRGSSLNTWGPSEL